ncbi:MAG: DnaA ATPase domain-containing protein [Terriglobia bacterium]
MEKHSRVKIVVASPGDVADERKALGQVVDEINRTVAGDLGLTLTLYRWETDAHPGFHVEGPQGLIDSILRIEESDLFIGIFWKRFGSPVKGSDSGTEHEFRRAYESWKTRNSPQILFYFSERKYTLRTKQEHEQIGRIIRFRGQFPKEGLWWTYKNLQIFKQAAREHLLRLLPTFGARKRGLPRNPSSQTLFDNAAPIVGPREPLLNPRYTFDTFVVGTSNQFAHVAAYAVAETPAKAYNPLFLYAAPGLGKTHLMQAVGHLIQSRWKEMVVVYVDSEDFANQLLTSLRYDRMASFRDKYRGVDVLLVDDIQFIAGQELAQEEFLHTFNTLYETQKQVVISSDCPPKDVRNLEERLRARFSSGLIVDIGPPDLETRRAILAVKSEFQGITLPEEVSDFIARTAGASVRDLEGAFTRVLAYASLTGRQVHFRWRNIP